jgi:hypothetical protein
MLGKTEKQLTERIVTSALKAGYLVGAFADSSADCEPTDNLAEILDSAFSYDCVDLVLRKGDDGGWIALNFFEDGKFIVEDFSVNLESFIERVTK